ncbi:MAG: methyltransferase domain-containing protein [Candidatus Pacearchaeota archaeon]
MKYVKKCLRLILELKERGTVLDLGAGKGKLSKFFYEKGFNVTAIDKSRKIVDALKKKFKNKIKIKREELEKIKLREKYDIIIVKNVLHLIRDRKTAEKLINKIKKYTKEDGINFIVGLTTRDPFYNKKKFFIKKNKIKKLYKNWKCLFSKTFFTNLEKHDKLPFHKHNVFIGLFQKRK